MLEWVEALIEEYACWANSETQADWPAPRLRPPATPEEIGDLEQRFGQPLEPAYRSLLQCSDGLDNFYMGMPILGCRDWRERSPDFQRALDHLELISETGLPTDLGLPRSVPLAPVSIDFNLTSAAYVFDAPGISERVWWVGDGDSLFFPDVRHLFMYATDSDGYSRVHPLRGEI